MAFLGLCSCGLVFKVQDVGVCYQLFELWGVQGLRLTACRFLRLWGALGRDKALGFHGSGLMGSELQVLGLWGSGGFRFLRIGAAKLQGLRFGSQQFRCLGSRVYPAYRTDGTRWQDRP